MNTTEIINNKLSEVVEAICPAIRELLKLEVDTTVRNCINCKNSHYNKDNNTLMCIKFSAFPPLDIVVKGCESFDDKDEIPY